jgi:hypothetical protein
MLLEGRGGVNVESKKAKGKSKKVRAKNEPRQIAGAIKVALKSSQR